MTDEAPKVVGLNIYQRMQQVRDSDTVRYIRKDATVQGYKAVTHDMVTAMCRQAMLDAGVFESTTLIDSTLIDTGKVDSKGGKVFLYKGRFGVEFVNVDSPQDRYGVVVEAIAIDNGDKHAGKANSMAKKYAMLKELAIETGENEESRAHEDEPVTYASKAEIDSIAEMCRELAVPYDVALDRILKTFQLVSVEQLTPAHVLSAKDWIARAASKRDARK